MADKDINEGYRVPDKLWEQIEPLLPPERPKPKGGRPRMDNLKAMDAIFYLLHTGCQWKALPPGLGAPSTVHDRFQEWHKAGVFHRMWGEGLTKYDELKGLDWEWQSMDGAMTKAPLGGEKTGGNPTDRGKSGTKRSLLTEGNGIPLAVAVEGANRHDMKLVKSTLEAIVAERPEVTDEKPQNMCMDKGYDYEVVRELVAEWEYIPHIKARGEEISAKQRIPGYRARRWVVERTHSWMNRFRRLLIRWEKKADNYLAMVHFACAYITFHATGVFG